MINSPTDPPCYSYSRALHTPYSHKRHSRCRINIFQQANNGDIGAHAQRLTLQAVPKQVSGAPSPSMKPRDDRSLTKPQVERNKDAAQVENIF